MHLCQISCTIKSMAKGMSFQHLNGRKLILWALNWLSPLFVYGAISWVAFGPKRLADLTQTLFTSGGDPEMFMWFMNWWPFALTHHLNLFFSHYIYYPQGFNLAWATAEPAVALAMAPITWWLGAQASYNLVALASPALAAAAAFYLIRLITRQYWPALVGGFVYGFSSYELGQMLGHPNLYVTFLLPLLVLVFWLRLHEHLSRWQYVVLAAALAALQFATSIEVFTVFAVFAALVWAVFWWFSPADLRRRLWCTAVETVFAGVGTLVLSLPYMYYLLAYYHTVPHILNPPSMFSADLLNFIIPTGVTRWSSAVWPIAYHFVGGNWSEAGSYLGWPLILILIIFMVQQWQKSYVKALTVTLVGLAVASLGPDWHIYGEKQGIRLPWDVGVHVPFIRLALPARFSLFVALVAAVMVGLWLANRRSRWGQVAKYALVALAIVCLWPNSRMYSWSVPVKVPPAFTAQSVGKYFAKGENIAIVPHGPGGDGDSSYYQVASGMWFTMTGGYAGYTPPNRVGDWRWSSSDFARQLKKFCHDNRVSKIVYTPETPRDLVTNVDALGWPTKHAGGVVIVSVPK
jgi:hypothetical protein